MCDSECKAMKQTLNDSPKTLRLERFLKHLEQRLLTGLTSPLSSTPLKDSASAPARAEAESLEEAAGRETRVFVELFTLNRDDDLSSMRSHCLIHWQIHAIW